MVQARRIMHGLSSELTQARAQITNPPPYEPGMRVDMTETQRDGSAYVAPPIPAVIPISPGVVAPHYSPPANQNLEFSNQPPEGALASRQPGLVLGGIETPPLGTPPSAPSTPPINGSASPFTPGPSAFPAVPVGNGSTLAPQRGSRLLPSAPGQVIPSNGVRATPPGGLIGAHQAIGPGHLNTGRTPSVVNPVGGVIGSGGTSGGTLGTGNRGIPSPSQMVSTMGLPKGAHDDHKEHKTWHPDNTWRTAEGVIPVIRPPHDQIVDPGPAIGLR